MNAGQLPKIASSTTPKQSYHTLPSSDVALNQNGEPTPRIPFVNPS